jgi:hypothetical protein
VATGCRKRQLSEKNKRKESRNLSSGLGDLSVTPLTHHLSTDLNFRSDQVIRIPTATGRHVGETCKTEAPILLIQTGSLSPNEIRYPLKQYIPSAVIQNKICEVFDKEMCRVGASVPRLLASSILKLHFQ